MYVQLTPENEFTIKLVAQLLPFHGHDLSGFERELCDTIIDRFVSAGDDMPPITDAEWPVLEEAAQTMADAKAKQIRVHRPRYSVEVLTPRGHIDREGQIVLCVRAGGMSLSAEQSRALRAELEAAERELAKWATVQAIFTGRKAAA